MKNKVEPKTLSGFMELMPQDQILFSNIKRTIEEVYASYGYYELDTPIIESSEVLLAKAGGETEKQIYRFQKGDSDLSLRFDLTVPLAKYVAARYNELTFPFKVIFPAVGVTTPVIIFNSVDFPAPFFPTTPSTSPFLTSKLKSCIAWNTPCLSIKGNNVSSNLSFLRANIL